MFQNGIDRGIQRSESGKLRKAAREMGVQEVSAREDSFCPVRTMLFRPVQGENWKMWAQVWK